MKIRFGKGIAKGAILTPGCAAAIFDERRERIFLTRREDNRRWCLPGGHMEPGESAAEACVREALEETGLHVEIVKLIGIYTSPDMVIQHHDGPLKQLLSMCFEARVIGGQAALSDETTEFGWFTPAEIESMDLIEIHRQRIVDALANQTAAFIR